MFECLNVNVRQVGWPCIIYSLFIFLQRYKNYFKYANILSIIFKIVRPHIEALIPYRVWAGELYLSSNIV